MINVCVLYTKLYGVTNNYHAILPIDKSVIGYEFCIQNERREEHEKMEKRTMCIIINGHDW